MTDTTEAVRLATEALRATVYHEDCPHEDADPYAACLDCGATAAVTAALPALAEQMAALIEAAIRANPLTTQERWQQSGLIAAARLVREAAEVTG